MKKLVFTLLLAITAIFAHAQEKDYKTTLVALLKSADNDFKDITGKMIAPIPDMEPAAVYTCIKGLGIGDEIITRNDSTGVAYYLLQIKEKDAAGLKRETNLLIDHIVKESKFTKEESKDENGKPILLLKDKEGFKVLQTIQMTNDETEEELYGIFIFGKTLKEQMKADEDNSK